MQLEHSFTVPVDIEKAWEVLLDIEQVAPCMPGAVLDSVDGDNFTGRVKIKLGPVNLTYKGAASFIEKDAAAHRAVIDASGKDARGNGTAAAKVTATMVAQGDSTKVDVLTDLNITGKPAQFGRGVMVDVGNKLIGQFTACLEGKLAGEPEAAPVAAAPEAPASPEPTAAAAPAASSEAATSPASDTAPIAAAGPPAAVAQPTTAQPTTAQPAPGPAKATPPQATPPAAREEPEPIDLLQIAGGSMLTRVVPAAIGAFALLLVLLLWRRRR
ncbi:hypothetical protein BH20ACT5_BH20ACT5_09590 [soil metagenome]